MPQPAFAAGTSIATAISVSSSPDSLDGASAARENNTGGAPGASTVSNAVGTPSPRSRHGTNSGNIINRGGENPLSVNNSKTDASSPRLSVGNNTTDNNNIGAIIAASRRHTAAQLSAIDRDDDGDHHGYARAANIGLNSAGSPRAQDTAAAGGEETTDDAQSEGSLASALAVFLRQRHEQELLQQRHQREAQTLWQNLTSAIAAGNVGAGSITQALTATNSGAATATAAARATAATSSSAVPFQLTPDATAALVAAAVAMSTANNANSAAMRNRASDIGSVGVNGNAGSGFALDTTRISKQSQHR